MFSTKNKKAAFLRLRPQAEPKPCLISAQGSALRNIRPKLSKAEPEPGCNITRIEIM